MDKNTFIGLLLIGAIMIGFSVLNSPSDEQIAEQKRLRDSIEKVEFEKARILAAQEEAKTESIQEKTSSKEETIVAIDSTLKISNDSVKNNILSESFGAFAKNAVGEERIIKVENELMTFYFNTKGGKVEKVVLKDYKTYNGEELVLFDSTSKFNLNFFTRDNNSIYTDELYFETNEIDFEVSGDNEREIAFKVALNDDQYIEQKYTIKGNDFLMDFDLRFIGMDKVVDMRSGEIYLNWEVQAPNQEKSIKSQRDATTIYYKYKGEDVDYITPTSDEKENYESSLKWVSLKQQFFNTAIIADDFFDKSNAFAELVTDETSENYVKRLNTVLTIPVSGSDIEQFGMALYMGPNKYNVLNKYDNELQNIIDLGWGIFGWVNKFAVIPVFNYLDSFHWNYGIIILILTILLKLVLSPITYKTYLSGAKMRVLKPEINEINDKFKDDAMKKQQAMMSLYKQTGVNPLSGCIPLLIQMPILIAMFRFFPASIELRQESFLWADDLSTYDSIYNFPEGFSIPFYGDHISLFTLLMAVSIMLYTKMNSQMSMGAAAEGAMAAQMKIMMYIMPFMMLFFFNNYSSGLSYYYFLANIISIGQTVLIRKVFINEDSIRAKIEVNKKKPKSQKKSGFQKRLEEMAKQKGQALPKKKK